MSGGNSRNESRFDDDFPVSYGGRQQESTQIPLHILTWVETPPKKNKTEYKKGEVLEFDFTKKGSAAKNKGYSVSKDYNKNSISTSSLGYCKLYDFLG
jgi:hypothetical protein